MTKALRKELWLSKHLNEVIRDMRQQGEIEGDGFTEKFAENKNPLLRLNDRPKQLELF